MTEIQISDIHGKSISGNIPETTIRAEMVEDITENMKDKKVSVIALVVDQTTESQTTPSSTEKIIEALTEKMIETAPEKMAETVTTEVNMEMSEYEDDSVFSDMVDQQTTEDSSIEGLSTIVTDITNKDLTTIKNNEVNDVTENAAVESTTTQPNILSVADIFNEDKGILIFIFNYWIVKSNKTRDTLITPFKNHLN